MPELLRERLRRAGQTLVRRWSSRASSRPVRIMLVAPQGAFRRPFRRVMAALDELATGREGLARDEGQPALDVEPFEAGSAAIWSVVRARRCGRSYALVLVDAPAASAATADLLRRLRAADPDALVVAGTRDGTGLAIDGIVDPRLEIVHRAIDRARRSGEVAANDDGRAANDSGRAAGRDGILATG